MVNSGARFMRGWNKYGCLKLDIWRSSTYSTFSISREAWIEIVTSFFTVVIKVVFFKTKFETMIDKINIYRII